MTMVPGRGEHAADAVADRDLGIGDLCRFGGRPGLDQRRQPRSARSTATASPAVGQYDGQESGGDGTLQKRIAILRKA
jgi:hypothetical protein